MLINREDLDKMISLSHSAKHYYNNEFSIIEKFLIEISDELSCHEDVTIIEEKPFNGDD